MEELWFELASQFSAQSWAELLAVVLAIAYVWLAARQNIWCWPCALVSTGIYIWLFWEVSLPFQTLLNAYYLLMAVYGWMKWLQQQDNPVIQQWPLSRHLYWIVGLTVVSLALPNFSGLFADTKLVYLDAFVTVFSVFTTFLVAHKVLENWLYWIVINTFAAYLYLQSGLILTACLFVFYIFFAFYGYNKWKHERNSQSSSSSAELNLSSSQSQQV
jgi:nicotinamide mononucleotide transporter